MAKAMLVDFSKCIGCRACQVACKAWNQRDGVVTENTGSYENPPDLAPQSWTRIKFVEEGEGDALKWHFRRMMCQHCTEAACEQVCPPKAISHQGSAVVIDQEKCTGCKYCVSACPFSVPRYDAETNTAMKCTLCIDRTSNDKVPACAKVCAPGAVLFGERQDMLKLAKDRVLALKAKGEKDVRLYGETELGGLGVMLLMTTNAEALGLPEQPVIPVSVGLWQNILKPLTIIAGGGGLLAAGLSLIGSIGYKHADEGGE